MQVPSQQLQLMDLLDPAVKVGIVSSQQGRGVFDHAQTQENVVLFKDTPFHAYSVSSKLP